MAAATAAACRTRAQPSTSPRSKSHTEPQKADGTLDAVNKKGWDVKGNKRLSPPDARVGGRRPAAPGPAGAASKRSHMDSDGSEQPMVAEEKRSARAAVDVCVSRRAPRARRGSTDRYPRRVASACMAARRVTTRAPITESEIAQARSSDISALMNTVNLESAEDLSDVARSPQVDPQLRAARPRAPCRSTRTPSRGGERRSKLRCANFEPRLARQDDQGPTGRHGVAGRTEGALPGQRRAAAAAGQRSHAIRRGDRGRHRQDQDRSAVGR